MRPAIPMPLLNPGAGLRPARIRHAGARRNAVQQDSLRPDRSEAGRRDQSLHRARSPRTARSRPTTPSAVRSIAWTRAARPTIANNFDFRMDHHFSDKNTVFGRAYMMWDTDTANRRRNHIHHAQPVSHVEHRRRMGPHLHSEPDPGSCAAASMRGRWWSTRPIRKAITPETGRLFQPERDRRILSERRPATSAGNSGSAMSGPSIAPTRSTTSAPR